MRHLDANALAQLIGAMADVIVPVTAPSAPLPPRLAPSLVAAIEAFDAGWRPPAPLSAAALAAQVERLAAAGMAFIEGDPVTAGQLLAEPVDAAAPPAVGAVLQREPTLAERVAGFANAAAAAQHVAADLTGRQLARRGFPRADGCIAAFRRFSAGQRAAADALSSYAAIAEAAEGRRRLVAELLDDTPPAERFVGARDAHLARLHDKATTVDDEMAESVDRCVAAVRAAIPGDAELANAYAEMALGLAEVGRMLAEAAAAERAEVPAARAPQPGAGDARSAA